MGEENTVLVSFVFGVPLHALISFSQDVVPNRLTFIATAAALIYGLHSTFYVFKNDYLQIVREQLHWKISYKNNIDSDLPSRIMPSKGLRFDRIPMIRYQSYCSSIRRSKFVSSAIPTERLKFYSQGCGGSE